MIKIDINAMLNKISADSASGFQSFGEFHGMAKVVKLEKHIGQTGKTSIKMTLEVSGKQFSTYLPLTDKMLELTQTRILLIAKEGGLGEENLRKLVTKIQEDEDVNTLPEFVIELAEKISKKIEKNEINFEVYADRIKEADSNFWSVKISWKGKPEEPKKSEVLDTDSFLAGLQNG